MMANMNPSNQYDHISRGDGITGAGIPYGISSTTCDNYQTQADIYSHIYCQQLKRVRVKSQC